MNDIKVGDRVRGIRSGNDWVVMGIDGDMAWLKSDGGEYTERFCKVLTRIEPEKVVLTPKYSVGQRVNCIGQGKVQVTGPEVGYHIEGWGGLWPESLFEFLPEPCDKCKGSGVASEGGA